MKKKIEKEEEASKKITKNPWGYFIMSVVLRLSVTIHHDVKASWLK